MTQRRKSKLEKMEGALGMGPKEPPSDEGQRYFSYNPASILRFGHPRDKAARQAAIAERRAELEAQGLRLAPNARALPIAPSEDDGEKWRMSAQAALIASAD